MRLTLSSSIVRCMCNVKLKEDKKFKEHNVEYIDVL